MITTETEIFAKVRQAVVEALAVDEEEVTLEARLSDDLGAESIDYLDIAFQLEKTFGIQIKPSEFAMDAMVDERYVQDGKLTDAGLAEVRRRIPGGRFELLEQSRAVADVRGVFTVETLMQFVRTKLDR